MQNADEWKFPHSLRPDPEKLMFNLSKAINSVVKVRTVIPSAAFTADVLGTERIGSGVLINDSGLILTVGYLVTEAETVWLTTNLNQSILGHVVAYDQVTGLGLVQTLGSLDIEPSELDPNELCTVNDDIFFVSYGGIEHALNCNISRIDEFAGYWEYLLEDAIYTSPPHPQWGGAAVFNTRGYVIGIGSLFLQNISEAQNQQGNLAIPISILKPILGAMVEFGRALTPARPWLGMYTVESEDGLIVSSLARYGPAELAGILQGDKIIGVSEGKVSTLASLFRSIWSIGAAGVSVPINIHRDGNHLQLAVNSIDRNDFLLKPQIH